MKLSERIKDFIFFIIAGFGYKQLPTSVEGHYPILGKKNFYKIALKNKKFFEIERQNYKFLNNFPEIKEFLSCYDYSFNYFKTDILYSFTEKSEHIKSATEILKAFKNYGSLGQIELEKMLYMKKGLEIIKNIFGLEVFENCKLKAERILAENEFRLGICHGDFHPKNILKNKERPVLIDFDCVRKSSIQEFDCIYFVVQSLIDYDGFYWWHQALESDFILYEEFLSDFVKMNKLEDLKFIYFIDRIGQDFKYENPKELEHKEAIESNLRMFKVL